MSKLTELCEKTEKWVQSIFEKHSEIKIPIWLMQDEEEHTIAVGTPFTDTDSKDAVSEAIRKIIASKKIIRYAFVSEAWVVIYDKTTSPVDTDNEPRPSIHPKRTEVVMIHAEDTYGELKVVLYKIDRSGEKPIIIPLEDENKELSKGAFNRGRFTNLFGTDNKVKH